MTYTCLRYSLRKDFKGLTYRIFCWLSPQKKEPENKVTYLLRTYNVPNIVLGTVGNKT